MQVEVLYFDGCPTDREAEKILGGVLAQEDAEADVECSLPRQGQHIAP